MDDLEQTPHRLFGVQKKKLPPAVLGFPGNSHPQGPDM